MKDLFDEQVEEDIDPEDELEATLPETSFESYTSPIMERVADQRLTVDLLAEVIPIIRQGEEAAALLASGKKLSKKAHREATLASREAQQARQRVFMAALPLIRTIAQREFRRRQQWNSKIPLDDLMQDAIVGFFKGLNSFKQENVRKSATNYLGQWMLSEMRRAAESMDHDLQVGHDAGERFRRVRALRSRLINDLEREPTDEEIADASRNPNYVTRPGMVGRAPAEGEKAAIGKGLTVAQVAEERAVRNRVGQASRFGESEDSEDSGSAGLGMVAPDRVAPPIDASINEMSDPATLIDESTGEKVIIELVSVVLGRMNLPEQQVEIISRRYGLSPFPGEGSAREISRIMGIHRERVSRVLAVFAEEMTRRGGVFHQVVSKVPSEDLIDLGLGWIVSTLGEWEPEFDSTVRVPNVLTEPISLNKQKEPSGSTDSDGVLAWFLCDYDDRTFSGLYEERSQVPKARPCPDCQRPSALVRTK
jgi:RNA polymerase sigma factor (sigma-70 family)